MRVGNLPQASLRSRGAFAFQVLRVFIVTAIAASGALAVSLSVDDPGAAPETVAAADRLPDGASLAQAAGETSQEASQQALQAATVQVATADPLAGLPMDGGAPPSTAAEPPVQESAAAVVPVDASGGSAAAPAANPGGDTPLPEAQHQAVSDVPPPVDAEMTGAVTVPSPPGESDPAGERIDLNTASVEQLNALRNAGPIARAIIRGRPYASVEDLVKRKVLRRSVYERIKDQVAVR